MNHMKKLSKKLLFLATLFCSVVVVNAQTPVAKHGQLKIYNGKVSNQQNNPVVLRGMSLFWSGFPEGAPYYNATTIKWLRDDWCVDVIRVAMSVETGTSNYINNPTAEMNKVKAAIDACVANGLYVLVDFHTHNAQNYKTQAKAFFTEIANTYGHLPNVLYEPFNEPINQSWSGTIKPYHNELISTIRAIDSDNIIICGTRTYSQEVDEAANDQVTGTNIAYTLHYYANSHQGSLRQKATNALNKGVALFVTEYGTCDASGNGGYNAGESQTWWDYLETNKISSCNWSVVNKNETAAALTTGTSAMGNWSASNLTQSGTLVRNYIKGKCNVAVVTGSVTVAFAGGVTTYNQGDPVTMTATATVANGTISKVVFYSGTTVLNTDTQSPYTFTTTTLAAGGHAITAKSYDATNTEIAVSPVYNINIVGASNVSTTGITDQFEDVTQFSEMTGGVNGTNCATATAGATAGIYWFEDRNAATAFKAEATRAGNGKLQYLLSQAQGQYNVIGFNFGEYCQGGTKKKYTLDLTQNAVLQLTIAAPATNTATLDLKFQMKDINGVVIAINRTVLLPNGTVDGPNWYKHEIGYTKNHVAPDYLSLAPGMSSVFTFDFKNALTVNNPNNPTYPTDIRTNNSNFDFSNVAEVVIVPVNKLDTGSPSYSPLAYTDQIINFSGLKLGNPALGVDICTTPNAVTTTAKSYCENATNAVALTATGTAGLVLKWYTSSTGGVANTTAPIPSTSVPGVTTYYVSQATSSPNTCEGARTALNVTIAASTTANAGSNQMITTATSVPLTGTGSSTGTWTVTGPAGATVTFTPSATSANATANGLTATGVYTFKYTVAGTAPCASTFATSTVTKSTTTATNSAYLYENVELYPNPVTDKLYINMSKIDGQKTLTVVDVMGRIVYETENGDVENIDMSTLSKGMYFVHVKTESGELTKAIIKQ
jgi:endoglucanase